MSCKTVHKSLIYLVVLLISATYCFSQTVLENAISEGVSESITEFPKEPDVKRIAILPLTGDETGEIANRLVTAVVAREDYKVIDRQQLKILFKEAEFQMTDVVDQDTAVRAGRIAGVDAVIYGAVKRLRYGEDWADLSFHVQAVKVQTGEIFWADDVEKAIGEPPFDFGQLDSILLYGITAVLIVIVAIVIFTRFKRKSKITGGSGQVEITRRDDSSEEDSESDSEHVITTDSTPEVIKEDKQTQTKPKSKTKKSKQEKTGKSKKVSIQPSVKVTQSDSSKSQTTTPDASQTKIEPTVKVKRGDDEKTLESRTGKISVQPGVKIKRKDSENNSRESDKDDSSKKITPTPGVKVKRKK